MSKEQKQVMKKLRAKFKKVNDEFLCHFERRYIVFIEDGTDLVKDLNLFNKQIVFNQENSAEGVLKVLDDRKKQHTNVIATRPGMVDKQVNPIMKGV